jgi:hypothetical protein
MVTSSQDLFLPWQLADWAQLSASAAPRRLVIAPWVHEDLRLFRLYLREALAWLGAQVRGDGRSLSGGPVRYYEIPELVRVAAPVHLKFTVRNAPGLYPSGEHLAGLAVASARERVRRAAIGIALLRRHYPDATASA